MTTSSAAEPLIELYSRSPNEADPFDPTDYTLMQNILCFANSANPRRGTDVGLRTFQVTQFMMSGLGYKHPENDLMDL